MLICQQIREVTCTIAGLGYLQLISLPRSVATKRQIAILAFRCGGCRLHSGAASFSAFFLERELLMVAIASAVGTTHPLTVVVGWAPVWCNWKVGCAVQLKAVASVPFFCACRL